MFHIIQLAEGFKFGQTVKGKTFLLPEVSILRSCKEAEAVDGGPMRSLLATAGRIDYVAVYIPDWQSMGLYGTTSIEGIMRFTEIEGFSCCLPRAPTPRSPQEP